MKKNDYFFRILASWVFNIFQYYKVTIGSRGKRRSSRRKSISEDDSATFRTLTGHGEMMSTLIKQHQGRVVDSPGDNGFTGCLGEGCSIAGEYDKANQTFQKGLELAEHYGLQWWIARQHRLMGEITMKTNPAQAKDD